MRITGSSPYNLLLGRDILRLEEFVGDPVRNQIQANGGRDMSIAEIASVCGATDKVPAGFSDAVAEYFRKLSKGN